MKLTVQCGVLSLVLLSMSACTDACRDARASAQQRLKQVVKTLERDTSIASFAVALPPLSTGEVLLIVSPYAITENWLKQNTTLDPDQQRYLIDLSNGVENVLIVLLGRQCVLEHRYLDGRFDLATGEPILRFETGDQIVWNRTDDEYRPVKLSKE